MGHMRAIIMGVAAAAALLATSCQPPPGSSTPGAGTWAVNPSATDASIAGDAVSTHLAYQPTVAAVGKLAVIFPGTSATTLAFSELTRALTGVGYHVIVLRYPNSLGTTAACPDSNAATDPDCFRVFRSEVVFGAGVDDPDGQAYDHPTASVNQSNSVVNRLTKLLDHLNAVAPAAGWGQFQVRSGATCTQVDPTYGGCAIDWSKVTVVGHSQGAGVGLYLAKFFPLHRVVMLSGAFDAYDLGGGNYAVAPWITEGPLAVPAANIGSLIHTSDPNAARIRAVAQLVGIPGPEADVSTGPSFGGSRQLVTGIPSACPIGDSAPSHNSTAVDLCVPDYAYDAAWRYLATS